MSGRSMFWRSAVATLLAAAIALPAGAAIPASERQVLIDLYNSTDGDNWTNNTGWKIGGQFDAPGTECNWKGITCDTTREHVVEVTLINNSLNGTIPDLLGLSALTRFHVPGNNLTGTLPALPDAIEEFLVFENDLSGTIPDLSGFPALKIFSVSENSITGALPALPDSIERLMASENSLSGTIPDLSSLPALKHFSVRRNSLTGPLPALSGSIEIFYADSNDLSGSIPDLSGLSALKIFYVPDNNLTGTLPALPDSIGMFAASSNRLSGTIPDLSGLSGLTNFYVHNNNLTGSPTSAPPASLAYAQVCPNYLEQSGDSAINSGWEMVLNKIPWNDGCADPANAPALWTVTVNVSGGNGSTWPSAPQTGIANGVATSFRVIPDSGFEVDSVDADTCGGSLSGNTWITDPVTADCTVTVSFKLSAGATTPIPTLAEWALILMGMLLAGMGAVHVRRRRI